MDPSWYDKSEKYVGRTKVRLRVGVSGGIKHDKNVLISYVAL